MSVDHSHTRQKRGRDSNQSERRRPISLGALRRASRTPAWPVRRICGLRQVETDSLPVGGPP